MTDITHPTGDTDMHHRNLLELIEMRNNGVSFPARWRLTPHDPSGLPALRLLRVSCIDDPRDLIALGRRMQLAGPCYTSVNHTQVLHLDLQEMFPGHTASTCYVVPPHADDWTKIQSPNVQVVRIHASRVWAAEFGCDHHHTVTRPYPSVDRYTCERCSWTYDVDHGD